MWDKIKSIVAIVVEVIKIKVKGGDYMPDWRTIAKMIWPWLLGILTNTIAPRFNLPADVIAAIVTVLNYLFAVLVIGTVANAVSALNANGTMKGLGFRK